MADDIVILSAVRTPIGTLNGALSSLSAHDLGAIVITESLKRAQVSPDKVSEVLMGQVLTAGAGQNPSRQAAMKAGIPKEIPASIVNMLCGSGLRSVAMAMQAIKCGDADIIVAGGQESMSQAPHCVNIRSGVRFGDTPLVDTLQKDGLMCAFNSYLMGVTAENIARQWNISREEQDKFACESQRRTALAVENQAFKEEIVPVYIQTRKGKTVVEKDEFPKPATTMDGLYKLRPVFDKESGTVTAGNASGTNDGAAAVVVTSRALAEKNGFARPMAKIVGWAHIGVDPAIMGTGPIPAVRKAIEKANWKLEEIELFELNEAFAAQSLSVIKELGLDPNKVNVRGGAIALGHPIGASGTRILVTLLHALRQTNKKKGVAALCIGGGMGIAMCVEMI